MTTHKRSEILRFRVNCKESKTIRLIAKRFNLTISELLRDSIIIATHKVGNPTEWKQAASSALSKPY